MPTGPFFQAFTIKFNGLVDRIVTAIAVTPGYDPGKPPAIAPARVDTNALWDTGASKSVISASLAKSLALVPVGSAQVNHAGGTSTSPTYIVNFKLPNQLEIAGALVTEFGGVGFDAIVGMDVIGLGDLSISNVAGKTCMSFRTPSCEVIDYVTEANRLQFARVGRNDPCPCGKLDAQGKPMKFKRCHYLTT